MAIFYKGVGVGTHLHQFDLRVSGLSPRNPGATPTVSQLMFHIARGTTVSPYISLTRSYGVAKDYAVNASMTLPTATRPAYVYEIEIDGTHKLHVLDPMFEIANNNKNVYQVPSYHHNGDQSYMIGVVDPLKSGHHLSKPPSQPRHSSGSSAAAPILTTQTEAFARALRDAEILVVGSIPNARVINRFDEF